MINHSSKKEKISKNNNKNIKSQKKFKNKKNLFKKFIFQSNNSNFGLTKSSHRGTSSSNTR